MAASPLLDTSAAWLRFAPGPQWLRWVAGRIVGSQQDIHLNLKGTGQPVEHVHGRIHGTPFDPGQVWGGDTRIDRKRLLRQPAISAKLSDIPSETRPYIHAPQARDGPRLIHDVYAMNSAAPAKPAGSS